MLKQIKEMNDEGDWDERHRILNEEVKECKKQTRMMYYSTLEKKKHLINKHENVVLLDK